MSINIRTNIGPAMGGLSEHGTFRNSMYQQQEQEKKEKQKTPVRPAVVKDHVSAHFMINEDLRLKSTVCKMKFLILRKKCLLFKLQQVLWKMSKLN